MRSPTAKALLLCTVMASAEAFTPTTDHVRRWDSLGTTNGDFDEPQMDGGIQDDDVLECGVPSEDHSDTKDAIIRLAAGCNRGYGASDSVRAKMKSLIDGLPAPTSDVADTFLNGTNTALPSLQGTFRMIYTTASDVLVLDLSPLTAVGPIHQVFDKENSRITNVIDLLPKQVFPNIPTSILRANVVTRPSRNDMNRLGIDFESVKLQPVELLGSSLEFLPPLGFDVPRLPFTATDNEKSPGYFDILHFDGDMLVTRQPYDFGDFVFCRVDSLDD